MFDAPQLATLRALIERYIPADDTPGGIAAGVDGYLIGFLQGDGVGYLTRYGQALTALENEAQLRHGTAFAGLNGRDAPMVDSSRKDVWNNRPR